MLRAWVAVGRFFAMSYMRLGLYRLWSLAYRWLFERRFSQIPIRPLGILELSVRLQVNARMWRADGPKQLWDAVSDPARVQEVFDGKLDAEDGLDCDDFAIYAIATINASALRGLPMGVALPRLLTVMWADGWRFAGHNVCLVFTGRDHAFMDYGQPHGHANTVEGVARNVLKEYAPNATLLCWAVADGDLNPVDIRSGP